MLSTICETNFLPSFYISNNIFKNMNLHKIQSLIAIQRNSYYLFKFILVIVIINRIDRLRKFFIILLLDKFLDSVRLSDAAGESQSRKLITFCALIQRLFGQQARSLLERYLLCSKAKYTSTCGVQCQDTCNLPLAPDL